MKVNPIKLKNIIRKSSFNYRLEGSSILFETDKITSKMLSPDNTYAVIINSPNDVITDIKKNNFELNLDLRNSPFSKRVFHQFNSDECNGKMEGDVFIISDDTPMEAKFTMINLDHIVLKNELPTFTSNIEFSIGLDQEIIRKSLNICNLAKKLKMNDVHFVVENNKTFLQAKKVFTGERRLELSGTVTGDYIQDIRMYFSRKDFNEVFNLVKSEKEKEYKIKFIYDDTKRSGCASIEANDGTEQYILYSKRDENTDQLITFEQKYIDTPSTPDEWDYAASVEKMNGITYKWKKLGKEMFDELWIARDILSKSKSEAARIKHGTLVPWMTWSQYCIDIGSSRQVVNRWLQKAFGSLEGSYSDTNQIEHIETENDNAVQSDSETEISNAYTKSLQTVVGEDTDKNVDAYNGRNAPERIQKVMHDIESGKVDEAVVHVNGYYTYRDWFKPLFDGLLCFTNGDQQNNCFVYLGDKKEKFVTEFKKHGVIMQKVE